MPAAEFLYKTTGYYAPVHERSLLWNDLDAGVSWSMHIAAIVTDDSG